MIKIYLSCFLLLFSILGHSQNSIVIIGFNTDASPFHSRNYSTMYDHEDSLALYSRPYLPMQTIAIIRSGDNIQMRSKPYLIIPGSSGFRFATLHTRLEQGTYHASILLSTSLSHIQSAIKRNQLPTGMEKDIRYSMIDYINPDLYISRGYSIHESQHQLYTRGFCDFIPIHSSKSRIDNHLQDYVDPQTHISIVKEAVCKSDYLPVQRCDEHTLLPFSTSIKDLRGVHFSFEYVMGRFSTYALVPLWSGFHSQFLQKVKLTNIPGKMIKDFDLQDKQQTTLPFKVAESYRNFLISPDKNTLIFFYDTFLEVYDIPSKTLLKKLTYPFAWNQIIMDEWAFGNKADKWKKHFPSH